MADRIGALIIDLSANVARLQQDMNKAVNVVSKATDTMGKAWASFRSVAALAIGSEAIREIVKSAKEGEDSINKLTAAFKRQGDGIGLTLKELEDFADEMSEATKFDDKDFRDAESTLLKFGNVYGEVFTKALGLSADLAAFNGGDLQSSTQQLAAALANPAEGLKGLQSAIGKLTPAQNEMIKTFLRSNDVLGAQNAILGLVRDKVGGVAQELNTGYSKRIDDAAKSWDKFKEALGNIATLKYSVVSALDAITITMKGLAAVFEGGSFASGIVGDRSAMAKKITDLQDEIARKEKQGPSLMFDEMGNVIGEDTNSTAGLKLQLKDLTDAYDRLYQAKAKVDGRSTKTPKIGLTDDQISYLKGLDRQLSTAQNAANQGPLAGQFAQADQLGVLDQARSKILAINRFLEEQSEAMRQADADLDFRQKFEDFSTDVEIRTFDLKEQTAALGSNAEALAVLAAKLRTEEDLYRASVHASKEQTEELQEKVAVLKGPYLDAVRKNLEVSRQWQTGIKQAFSDLSDQAADKATQAHNAVVNAFQGMEDALVKFAQTGKLNFNDLANSIIADLIRIQVKQNILGPIAGALGGAFASGFAGGGGAGGGTGFVQLATGTNYVPQDMFAMIHKGEAVVPKEYNNGGNGSGTGLTISVVNNNHIDSRADFQSVAAMLARSRAQTRSEILDSIARNGQFAGAIRSVR